MYHRTYFSIRKTNVITMKFISFFEKRRYAIIIGLLLLITIIFSLSIITTSVTAEKSVTREKTVTSVKIEKGDSLWSIANLYITDEYKDMNTYIKEIMDSNGLTSDVLYEGSYIIVPYYTAKR
ncbi:LysM peptidoglycan-binding domain-containing protein [Anaerocolumna sp. AGMB13025]|uniref:LysM peptidoglycan-binding domain-containing protein n=1 Tax=Anaerocolumna sp. AGMB13025 TaxID=3039116 RepID=UPI00241EDDFE|nr:LysM peptidoglycan-binding domain-containing protein [Anaerocolumna sp. AGMB13025]WFR60098.1 LysM peptidoglycan-binding domain-containing protein [Anaerocolumna sp. AGMB13025]